MTIINILIGIFNSDPMIGGREGREGGRKGGEGRGGEGGRLGRERGW